MCSQMTSSPAFSIPWIASNLVLRTGPSRFDSRCQYCVLLISFPWSLTKVVQYFIDFLNDFISEISLAAVRFSLGINFFSNVASHTLLSDCCFASGWITTLCTSGFFFFLAKNFTLVVFQSLTLFSSSSSCFYASSSAFPASSLLLMAKGCLEFLLVFIINPVIVRI